GVRASWVIIARGDHDVSPAVTIDIGNDRILPEGAAAVQCLIDHAAIPAVIDPQISFVLKDDLTETVTVQIESGRPRGARGIILDSPAPETRAIGHIISEEMKPSR